jgi:hypothetical protein
MQTKELTEHTAMIGPGKELFEDRKSVGVRPVITKAGRRGNRGGCSVS